jgi:hypothetical protein
MRKERRALPYNPSTFEKAEPKLLFPGKLSLSGEGEEFFDCANI